MTDITVENHGSIFLVRAHSTEALIWLGDNVHGGAHWAGALAVGPRHVETLTAGLIEAGFTVA